eukprot:CAMPEP_0174743156 /NCGR_PEP_ID=MMETSP1094-20130205/80888_1 /TAXON_ID=156173 /ORGANISM="Chrysochromulina brevifilum, Strain UTEX LB 985" /LENGTH=82 /DNA_ID=CAMNT_0015947329 /DNA_START=109 /DNA_END=357 /DNA_ORIENTATION=+
MVAPIFEDFHHDVRCAIQHEMLLLEVDFRADDPEKLDDLLDAIEVSSALSLDGRDEVQPAVPRRLLPLLKAQSSGPNGTRDH